MSGLLFFHVFFHVDPCKSDLINCKNQAQMNSPKTEINQLEIEITIYAFFILTF